MSSNEFEIDDRSLSSRIKKDVFIVKFFALFAILLAFGVVAFIKLYGTNQKTIAKISVNRDSYIKKFNMPSNLVVKDLIVQKDANLKVGDKIANLDVNDLMDNCKKQKNELSNLLLNKYNLMVKLNPKEEKKIRDEFLLEIDKHDAEKYRYCDGTKVDVQLPEIKESKQIQNNKKGAKNNKFSSRNEKDGFLKKDTVQIKMKKKIEKDVKKKSKSTILDKKEELKTALVDKKKSNEDNSKINLIKSLNEIDIAIANIIKSLTYLDSLIKDPFVKSDCDCIVKSAEVKNTANNNIVVAAQSAGNASNQTNQTINETIISKKEFNVMLEDVKAFEDPTFDVILPKESKVKVISPNQQLEITLSKDVKIKAIVISVNELSDKSVNIRAKLTTQNQITKEIKNLIAIGQNDVNVVLLKNKKK